MIKKIFCFCYEYMIHCVLLLCFAIVMILIGVKSKKLQEHKEQKIAEVSYEQGYVAACKDFYKGKLKYDLIEHEDGTKTWERVKSNE